MNLSDDIYLMPFQMTTLKQIEKFEGRCYLALEMGLGKTAISLWALQRNPQWYPALVVCPASVKINWEHETMMHIGERPFICESREPPVFNRRDLTHIPKVTIINYDIFRYWAGYLKEIGIKTLILDEAHYLQNRSSKRTKAVRTFSRKVPQIFALSGTPIRNRPFELFPVLNILWPKQYNSFWSFGQDFCEPKKKPWGWEYKGASNLDRLNSDLTDIGMVRYRKADVLKELPNKVRRTVLCELSDRKEYHSASTDFISWLKKNNPHKVKPASKAMKLTRLGALLRLCATLKLPAVVNWANRFLEETDEKLILFAHHKVIIDGLKDQIKYKSVKIVGSTPNRERQQAVEQFQADKKTRLFIGSEAAAVGITLNAASTLGFAEMWWRPSDHEQAEARPHRIGQTEKVWINYFVAPNTVEERLCAILKEKQRITNQAMDGKNVSGDFNIHSDLLKLLEDATNNDKQK